MGLFLVNRDICIWQHPNIAFIYSRHPHRHLFLLWMKLSMLVGPIVLCLTSMAWNLGHGPLPVRSGIHRRQADHPTSSRDRINKVTIKTLYTKLKTDWFCCCLIWSGIRFSVQTLSEALRCSEVIVKTFRQTCSRIKGSYQPDPCWRPPDCSWIWCGCPEKRRNLLVHLQSSPEQRDRGVVKSAGILKWRRNCRGVCVSWWK